jgi:hypothetical protein
VVTGLQVKPTHLHKLFTPRITCVQLNNRKSFELSAKMCARRFSNARTSGDHNCAKNVHTILARLLETRLQAAGPDCRTLRKRKETHRRSVLTSRVTNPGASLLVLCSRISPSESVERTDLSITGMTLRPASSYSWNQFRGRKQYQ